MSLYPSKPRKNKTASLAFPRPERSKGTSYKRRDREPGRMIWCKSQPCYVLRLAGIQGACDGPIHAHHMGERGLGRKAPDDTVVPLCQYHHEAWHGCMGWFKGMSKAARQEFGAVAIALTRGDWLRLTDGERASWDARANNREAA